MASAEPKHAPGSAAAAEWTHLATRPRAAAPRSQRVSGGRNLLLRQDDVGALTILPIPLCLKWRASGEEAKLGPGDFTISCPRCSDQIELDSCSGGRSHIL